MDNNSQSTDSLFFIFIVQPAADTPPPPRLSLPYKVMKSLDGEVYRNLEFDVWQDTCKGNTHTSEAVCFIYLDVSVKVCTELYRKPESVNTGCDCVGYSRCLTDTSETECLITNQWDLILFTLVQCEGNNLWCCCLTEETIV